MLSNNFSNNITNLIIDTYYNKLVFLDKREREVFEEYLRAFSFISYSDDIRTIVEIGAGHSTLILAHLAKYERLKVLTIDLNPESMLKKLRDKNLVKKVNDNVEFVRNVSVSSIDFHNYYQSNLDFIAGIKFEDVLNNISGFINLKLDARRESTIKDVLEIDSLDQQSIKSALMVNKQFPIDFLDSYRHPDDEFDYFENGNNKSGVLTETMTDSVDAVFLDSGEFASLVEWEIVASKLRIGGYVFLHDIYFPKSFKNWLVCASIVASNNWEVLYQDRSTPQGMMLARKVK